MGQQTEEGRGEKVVLGLNDSVREGRNGGPICAYISGERERERGWDDEFSFSCSLYYVLYVRTSRQIDFFPSPSLLSPLCFRILTLQVQ